MSDKVDYSKIIINFNDLMMKMHQQAAEKVPQNFDIINLPTKDNNVFVIIAKTKDGSEPNKKDCLDVIKQYISVYVGEDAAKMVSQKNMQPIFAEPQKKDNQEQPNNNKEEEKTPGPENKSEQQQVQKESFYMSRKYRKIFESVDFLFEAEPATPDPSSPTPSPDPSSEPKPEPGKDEPPTPTGYSVTYDFEIKGPDAGRGFGKRMMGIMSGSLADLYNMEIKTFGGRTINIGSVFDLKKWDEKLLGNVDINIETVDNNLQAVFHDDFTQSSVQTGVQDVTSLKELIIRQPITSENVEIGDNGTINGSEKEIKDEILKRLGKAKYAVTILVEKRDPAYKQFTRKLIAWYCTKAFGTSLTVRNKNKVEIKDVIRINGWKDVQKRKSSFDVARTNPRNPTVSTSVTAKESQMFILRGDIVESIMNELFGSVVTEELITEVQSEQYKNCMDLLDKIGIDNLKANINKFKEEYSKAANQCQIRKTVKGKKGQEKTIITGVQIPTIFKNKTENSKSYEEYLKKDYMKNGKPFIDNVANKWKDCNTIDDAKDVMFKYISKNGSQNVGYSNEKTIECWMALEALKTLPQKEEKSNKIKIQFDALDPIKNTVSQSLTTIETEPGKINLDDEQIQEIKNYYQEEGYQFKEWDKDPNSLTEDGTVVAHYEKTQADGGEIEITFMKKDPSNPSAEEDEVKKLKAKPHEFDKIKDQYPTEEQVKYDNYKFTGWDPDPNEQDKDVKVFAKYESVENQITIEFYAKDPSNKSAEEKKIDELKGPPGKFDKEKYPKEEKVHFDKFQFTGWDPDPNILKADGKVLATYTPADIAVIFSSKDPTNKKAMEKTVLKTYISKEGLGKIDTKQAEDKLTKPDGYKFVEWEPNPNEYDEDHVPSDKTIRTSAQWAPESDEISVIFKYKNPADDKSPEKIASIAEYERDGFEGVQDDDINTAKEKLPKDYEGYEFEKWSPDPKEYDNTNIPDNGIITTIAQWSKSEEAGLLSIRFTYKDPTKENALPKTLSTYVTSEDEFGRIDDQGVANLLPKFDGFDFQFWDPDPNEYTKDTFPDNRVATVQAKFQKHGAENSDNQWDIFIVPHARITSSARPPEEIRYGDGTIHSKTSSKQREKRHIGV